ncbi:MAG TPA: TIGR00303 family protein, partial [Cyanobacteria bacterium UBA11166]|nr:TIGR00303 family protein [Cyanobacteria bacterium UBA11166]
PEDRKYTAIADAEFLVNGVTPQPTYPLPPLTAGASPVFISRAVVEAFNLPVFLFNAGLPQPPAVPAIDLGGIPAECLSTGKALPLETVQHLFAQGLMWGEKLADAAADGYVIIAECVVGGTTTALSVLTGLGIDAVGKVNSSHPSCNHSQKWEIVKQGMGIWGAGEQGGRGENLEVKTDSSKLSSPSTYSLVPTPHSPWRLVAGVGDPMQIVAAGMAIAVSRHCGVLLAGGTQMLAVYALAQAIAKLGGLTLSWQPEQIVVGTTRWVAEDPTGDTVGLAREIGDVPLLASNLNFSQSRYQQLQVYEAGFVKEGVGAGGCAIASYLYKGGNSEQLLEAIEGLIARQNQR